jgi:hypothetical protein
MKTPLIALFLSFLSVAHAGVDPSNKFKLGDGSALTNKAVEFNKGAGSANPSIRMDAGTGKLQFSNDGSLFKDIGSGSGSGSGIQLLTLNPDFEGTITNWSASVGGTFALAASGGNLLFGIGSGVFNSTATGQTVTSEAVAIPNGLLSAAGVVSCWVKTSATDYKLQAVQGSTVLSESVINASTVPYKKAVPFVFPSSGTVALRLASQSNAGDLAVDNCFLGSSEGIQLTQASLVGEAEFPATTNCTWSTTSAALGAFNVDTDCPAPVVITNPGPGVIQTTDADLPRVTLTSLPRGNYVVQFQTSVSNGSAASAELAIDDGTSTRGKVGVHTASTGVGYTITIEAPFNYSESGNRTFELFGRTTAGTLSTYYTSDPTAVDVGLKVKIYRLPDSSEQAFTAGTVAQSFQAKHANDCVFSTTSLTFADTSTDASCTFSSTAQNMSADPLLSGGDDLPGVVLGGLVVGKKYQVCVSTPMYNTSANYTLARWNISGAAGSGGVLSHYGNSVLSHSSCQQFVADATTVTVKMELRVDGSTGQLTDAGDATITWTGHALSEQVPAPVFAGSVMSPANGVVNMLSFTFAGDAGDTVACTSTPCTIVRQTGGVASVARSGTGAYQVSLNAGVFSATPTCTTSGSGYGVGTFATMVPATTTSTLLDLLVVNTAGAPADGSVYMICVGPK